MLVKKQMPFGNCVLQMLVGQVGKFCALEFPELSIDLYCIK